MPLRLASSISSVGQWVASTKRDPMVVVAEVSVTCAKEHTCAMGYPKVVQ